MQLQQHRKRRDKTNEKKVTLKATHWRKKKPPHAAFIRDKRYGCNTEKLLEGSYCKNRTKSFGLRSIKIMNRIAPFRLDARYRSKCRLGNGTLGYTPKLLLGTGHDDDECPSTTAAHTAQQVACCKQHSACCVLRVVCCVLRVACCVLRVACCVLRVALQVLHPPARGRRDAAHGKRCGIDGERCAREHTAVHRARSALACARVKERLRT